MQNKKNETTNEDALFKLAEQKLKKLKEKDLDFKVISQYEEAKEESKKIYKNLIEKIHKLKPSLSHGKEYGVVYETIIVRAAAMRIAHEKYDDYKLPRNEFMKKVDELITRKFIDDLDLDAEQNRFIEYTKNKKK